MKTQQLLIYLNEARVGTLEQTVTGKLRFSYSADARQPISLAMPIREEPYGEIASAAFFGGLLPESEAAKKIIGQRYGISPNNDFALLKAIGHDCAGAISCHATDEPFDIQAATPLTVRIISDEELYQHIKALPQKPLFMGVDGLRLSLAGVHDKAAVCLIDNQIALAEQGCPTTHILKPGSIHFPGMAENEYFCLSIAKRLGLPIPAIQLRQINDISFLLIERYDRKIIDSQVRRIHQEDFCQALGILSNHKYQNEGGPGFTACFELLNQTAQPAIDRNLLASVLVFNYLIANMDAHGKNFSLLHSTAGTMKLAPFYDLICTGVYGELTTNMAMKIASKYDASAVFPRHWQQLCAEIHYRYPAMKSLINKQANLILKIAREERQRLIDQDQKLPIVDKIIEAMTKTIERTVARFIDS